MSGPLDRTPDTTSGAEAAEKLLRDLLNGVPVIAVSLDALGRVTFANPFLRALLGYSDREIIGQDWFELAVPAEDRERVRSAFSTVLANEFIPGTFENSIVTRTGEARVVFWTNTLLRDAAGRVAGTASIGTDLTERRRAERALEASERRFATAFEANPNPMSISRLSDGRAVAVNESFLRLLGYDRQEVAGRTPADLDLWADPSARTAFVTELLREGAIRNAEVEVRAKSGQILVLLLSAERIELDGVESLLFSASDITERKKLEARLLEAQKMEAVGRLAGGVAHDFNNLLTVITGNTDLMLREQSLDARLVASLREVGEAAERAAALTRQLLAFGRKQMRRTSVLSLADVVRDSVGLLERLLGPSIRLSRDPAVDAPSVEADFGQIQHVLLSLAANARDAMPAGGVFRVGTDSVVLEGGEASELAVDPGLYATLTVSDTGGGMDARTRQLAFDPFFTTKEVGTASGMGLSAVYGIVTQNGGGIAVSSRPGKGARFTIYLPAAAAPAPAVGLSLNTATAATVLLVEDEDAIRTLAARSLEASGFKVLAAASGSQALDLLGGFDGEVALLVSDVKLPGMSGPALASRIAEERPRTRVLFTSGYSAGDPDADVPSSASFLEKPFTPHELVEAVRRAIGI